MSANNPPRISDATQAFEKRPDRPRSYVMAGVVGDVRHMNPPMGYHVDPDELPGSDYSVQTQRDRTGADQHPHDASAWDLHFGPAEMIVVTNRLLAAARKNDPRMKAVREFCGTRDGRNTYPWDLHGNVSEGINSWDSGHLSHVHISFYRDASAKQIMAVLDVICGKPASLIDKGRGTSTGVIKKLTGPKWPLAPGHYFGPISGPSNCHGGYFPSERGNVHRIQVALQNAGCAPKVHGWADGRWEQPTTDAMRRWQKKHRRHATGVCGPVDWKALVR